MSVFKEAFAKSKIRKAKDLAWDELSEKKQEHLLDQAEQLLQRQLQGLAIKCAKEAGGVTSAPGCASHLGCGEGDE